MQKPGASRDDQLDIAQQAWTLYDRFIRYSVEGDDENIGRFVVIDVTSEQWEVANDIVTAAQKLRTRVPALKAYALQVGFPTASRFGAGKVPAP